MFAAICTLHQWLHVRHRLQCTEAVNHSLRVLQTLFTNKDTHDPKLWDGFNEGLKKLFILEFAIIT